MTVRTLLLIFRRFITDFSSIYCSFFVFFVDLLLIFRRFIADFLYLLSFLAAFV